MAWNEPGGNRNDQDPWGSGKRGNDQGPPDLDEALRKGLDKLNRLFGGGGNRGSNNRSGGGGNGGYGVLLALVAVAVVVFLVFQSVYTVDARERGVVLRFGQYDRTVNPGLHFKVPLVDSVRKVQVTDVRSFSARGEMLTEDENIVDVNLSIQYVVSNPEAFTLQVREPVQALQYATDSSLRHEVGSMALHSVLTEGRAELASQVEQRLQHFLDEYKAGVRVVKVNVESTQPPKEVQDAFQDVQRAKEDEQRAKEEAETYRNKVVPEARGQAQRVMEEAQAYKQEVTDRAKGQAARFSKLLTAYNLAPKVTRERMYLDTMEKVMSQSSKVLLDTGKGDNVIYLPLNKLAQGTTPSDSSQDNSDTPNIQALTNQVINELRQRQNSTSGRGQ